ncbi:MAG: hypothetical protein BGP22_01350 [Variovorax sp. 67-131]|nr:MAG: hypothetical protein ABS94_30625 [Variovorax sp. SCN 67-85]ODV16935.1 MAG: hypothetical protein ABT25_30580 [Variovorax sp. SCN 67-20]OJZ07053.1 MAG: hypothetical protein BGP22_01350 [Variovorax sp. 67-131]
MKIIIFILMHDIQAGLDPCALAQHCFQVQLARSCRARCLFVFDGDIRLRKEMRIFVMQQKSGRSNKVACAGKQHRFFYPRNICTRRVIRRTIQPFAESTGHPENISGIATFLQGFQGTHGTHG